MTYTLSLKAVLVGTCILAFLAPQAAHAQWSWQNLGTVVRTSGTPTLPGVESFGPGSSSYNYSFIATAASNYSLQGSWSATCSGPDTIFIQVTYPAASGSPTPVGTGEAEIGIDFYTYATAAGGAPGSSSSSTATSYVVQQASASASTPPGGEDISGPWGVGVAFWPTGASLIWGYVPGSGWVGNTPPFIDATFSATAGGNMQSAAAYAKVEQEVELESTNTLKVTQN